MTPSIITLLTDFGTRDHYVASMKGVILSINPRCTLVDITHQVNPHDIKEAGFLLANSYSCFPKGTIHLCVVDPGVGGARMPILMIAGDHFFVGPDNGLFTLMACREKVKRVIALTNPRFFLPSLSATFHGRDIFAPVAAHLSRGVNPRAFGAKMNDWVKLDVGESARRGGRLRGEVIHVDVFGNLVTNVTEKALSDFTQGHPFFIRVGRRTIRGRRGGYWQGKPSELMGLIGSGGFLEISIREGNAQETLRLKKGDEIQITIESRK
jgi:S-adenosyl-L-methionine hydrolase (adenosine-forming)